MIEFTGGQAHHIIKVAVNAGNTDIANPFLDAVGTGLVQWAVMLDVIVNLVIGQFGKILVSEKDSRRSTVVTQTPLITRWALPERARNMR